MLKSAPILLVAAILPIVPAFAEGNPKLEELRRNAELFGFVSAGADYCQNLTLADIPEVKRAITMSCPPAVSSDGISKRPTRWPGTA